MRRMAGIVVVAIVVATWGMMATSARADHPQPGPAVIPVGHPGDWHHRDRDHRDWYHGEWRHEAHYPAPHPRPPVVVYPAPPVYSYYPAYRVVPRPYYPVPHHPEGVISIQGRHVGITLGF